MPTTTEPHRALNFPVRGIVAALLIWFGGMAAAAYVFDASNVIVFGPNARTTNAIADADGAMLASGMGFTTARSDRAGFVRRLYAGGAWFVWPALTEGCFAAGRFRR
jgi:hypothetical protein